MRTVALDVGSSSVRAVAYDETGTAEPGDAHLAYDTHDPDELVDACRVVLAQVGEGDALAISCFWHSLVALDDHHRPASPILTWRDAEGDPRRSIRTRTTAAPAASSIRRSGRRSSPGCLRRGTCRSPTTCCSVSPASS